MALQLRVTGGVSFQDLDPSGAADRYYVRHEGAGPLAIEAQQIRGTATWSVIGGRGTANRNVFTIPPPPDASAMRVTCRHGSESRSVEIWYLAATLVVTREESPGDDNPNWPEVLAFLRRRYVTGGESYDFPTLGRIQFRYRGHEGASVQYGDFVKLVGTISPPNVPLGFFHARRVVSASVTTLDASNRRLSAERAFVAVRAPGANDTSVIPSGALTTEGKIFDYDMPGGNMSPHNLTGDRHVWNVVFQQAIGVGQTSWDDVWTTLQTNARQLASIQWSVNYTVRYIQPPPGAAFGSVVFE